MTSVRAVILSFRAVVVGLLLEEGGVHVGSLLLALFFGLRTRARQLPPADAASLLLRSPVFMGGAIVLGIAVGFAGCFVAARMAPTRPVLHSVLVAVGSVLLYAIRFIVSPVAFAMVPFWMHVAALALVFPFAILAGMAAKRTRVG